MINFSSDPQINKTANEQLSYFVNKFKLNSNEYVLRAKGELIIRKALKDWNPSKGNLKTYLNGQLQQLSREIYKNQPVYVPENQQLLMYKARKIINNYKDTNGSVPDARTLAKEMNITEKKAKNLIQMYEGVLKPQYETDTSSIQQNNFSPKEIIDSIEDPLHRGVAKDLYINNTPKDKIFKKYGFKQTKFYEIKNNIDKHIQNYSEAMNTENSI